MKSTLSISSLTMILILILSSNTLLGQHQQGEYMQIHKPVNYARVNNLISSMSLEEKVAQLFIVYPRIEEGNNVSYGGFIFFDFLLKDPHKAKLKIKKMMTDSRIPPFLVVDIEGGKINSLKNNEILKNIPSPQQMSEMSDLEVERWGFQIGLVMTDYGLNMNLAPVLDVSDSGFMRTSERSFNEDPEIVIKKSKAFSKGLLKAGILPIGKHFPGYGNTTENTDKQIVQLNWDLSTIENMIDVFIRTKPWLGGVMVNNITYLSYGSYPAVFNKELLSKARSNGWLIITDDLAVDVLVKYVSGKREKVIEKAFLAGNDILLLTVPPVWEGLDYKQIILNIVNGNPELEERVNASCRRILATKDRMGLLDHI